MTSNLFAVDFNQINQNIIKPKCLSCHNQQYPAKGIDLSSYESILKIVTPYSAETSLLFLSVTGKTAQQMPLMQPSLSRQEIRQIKIWIEDGAYLD